MASSSLFAGEMDHS